MKKLLTSLTISALFLTACTDVGPVEEPKIESKVNSQALCDAIPKTTINTLVGEPYVAEPMEELDASTGGCKTYNTEDDRLFTRNFNIIARETVSSANSKDEYDRAIAVWKNGAMVHKTLENIEGVGTESFWAFGEKTTQLITYQDKNLLILSFGHYTQTEEELLELAKTMTSDYLKAL